MVVKSRQVASAASPVVVRVVTPRTTTMVPARLSTGVTPPKISRSISPSLYRPLRPYRPVSTAPPRGTAGSLSPAMAPATAAATPKPSVFSPLLSTPPGATSTTRSWFRALARAISSSTVSSAPPAATAMRSRRLAEAVSTLSFMAFCTSPSVLSQITAVTSSSPSRAAKPSP